METIDVPFTLPVIFINDLVEGMSREMGMAVPQSDKEKLLLFQEWVKHRAKETIRGAIVNRASLQADTSAVDAW